MIIHRMRFNYIYLLILLLALAVVKSDSVGDEEQKTATVIYNYICNDTPRDSTWFNCMSCCQGMFPFYLKKEPNAVVREKLYTEALFSTYTKKRMCADIDAYGSALRDELLENAGPLIPKYATAKAMSEFYHEKTDCFTGCQVNPAEKLSCIPFTVASYEQYDLPRQQQRERDRQQREAMKPKTGTNCALKDLWRFFSFRGKKNDGYLQRCLTGHT
ncbi:MAG: hypothetical protein J3R72DRAFT_457504 [Linnemannia gamsii]|nr:MAG: hypothetical protein J3R72DRAFT_457504 [Linnemannia gamsii]